MMETADQDLDVRSITRRMATAGVDTEAGTGTETAEAEAVRAIATDERRSIISEMTKAAMKADMAETTPAKHRLHVASPRLSAVDSSARQ